MFRIENKANRIWLKQNKCEFIATDCWWQSLNEFGFYIASTVFYFEVAQFTLYEQIDAIKCVFSLL